jgi:hypothetical protein
MSTQTKVKRIYAERSSASELECILWDLHNNNSYLVAVSEVITMDICFKIRPVFYNIYNTNLPQTTAEFELIVPNLSFSLDDVSECFEAMDVNDGYILKRHLYLSLESWILVYKIKQQNYLGELEELD